MSLKQLHVGSLGGLFYEMYHPEPDSLSLTTLQGLKPETALLHANALFWAEHFKRDRVAALSDNLRNCIDGMTSCHPAYRAIATNSQLFLQQVEESIAHLCDQGVGERIFFKYLETLSILCQLYSDLEYSPYTLTLYEGFLTYELSSLQLYSECLHPIKNPYFGFIQKNILPVIVNNKPDILWLHGRMTISGMAVARLTKQAFPSVHISVVGHSSEYYSLNKITKYLCKNTALFSAIDSIILDDTQTTQGRLVTTIEGGQSLKDIPNLLYAEHEGDELKIVQTRFQYTPSNFIEHISTRAKTKSCQLSLPPEQIANIKLFPNKGCHWNKCTFCGINKKYSSCMTDESGTVWEAEKAIDHVQRLSEGGVKYVWAIDEAVPPEALKTFATLLLERDIKVIWQVRARFDRAFLEDGLCDLLARSGLREIRFGLESASPRILQLMQKFSEDITRSVIENIICAFNDVGVSVHCPMIIAFPTETDWDRNITFAFLEHMRNKFPLFSFNINLFGLDVSSKMFGQWEDFGITQLNLPCVGKYFLGNLADWDCAEEPFRRSKLEHQRNQVMHDLLYPWMPPTALTRPHIFYRLSETVRNTLTFKTNNVIFKKSLDALTGIRNDALTVLVEPDPYDVTKRWRLYSWETHQSILLSEEAQRDWVQM